MKYITLILITLTSFANTPYIYDPLYSDTGWSGKIANQAQKDDLGRAAFKCAQSKSLSRDNFIPYDGSIGFSSQNSKGENGISFLTNTGEYAFFNYSKIPKNTGAVIFTLKDMTYIADLNEDGWTVIDIPTKYFKPETFKNHKVVNLDATPFDDFQLDVLLKGTSISLEMLANSKSKENEVEAFRSSNMINCLKTAKMNNNDKSMTTSLDMIARKNTQLSNAKMNSEINKNMPSNSEAQSIGGSSNK